ncbi:tautomerase family protein [Pseudonocardia sp. GCM10023141]|uniref:tautomerase family protein n=1 Tax=Pseudonocardia sp. GCM10023141 TaxID=3252653 RepID=UPI003618D355
MPFARITIADPATPTEVQHDLVRGISKLLVDVLDKEPEVVVTHVNLTSPQQWYVGGDHVTAATGAHLEVSITAGTNTPEEKSAFVREAYTTIRDTLGALPDAVYVALIELDGNAYGYNGVTQAQRRLDDPVTKD